jgi:hypothetical protein
MLVAARAYNLNSPATLYIHLYRTHSYKSVIVLFVELDGRRCASPLNKVNMVKSLERKEERYNFRLGRVNILDP